MRTTIGIDLGGTFIKGVLMRENGDIIANTTVPTGEHEQFTWKEAVKETLMLLEKKNDGPADCVGLSAPGLANEQNSCIAYLPNRLEGLENLVWGNYLDRLTYVLNDAHAALMAEAKFGVLKKYKNALMLTLGTGVGGGLLVNGELLQGLHQRAGHLGHIALNVSDDERSILGIPGSLEYSLGNYSVKRRTLDKFNSTKELVEAFKKGDYWATHVWLDSIKKLAVGISSLINAFSPEAIAISGGIVLAGNSLFSPLEEFLKLYEFTPNDKFTPILKSEFDEWAGAVGAAAFAISKN
ncbi:MAG: ROK family protein [Leadbetterella sp.]